MIDPTEFEALRTTTAEPEQGYLADMVSARITGTAPRPADGALRPKVLAELARVHKLVAFLPTRQDELPPGCGDIVPWLDVARLRTLQLNRQSLMAAAEVSTLLDAGGIAHLHFKGPLQQIALYGSPFQKPVGDADVLIHKSDRTAAYAILQRAGYRPTEAQKQGWWSTFLGEVHFRKAATGPMVDLHHSLQQPGLPSPYHPARFLTRARPVIFEGRAFPVTSPADRCLIAAVSVVKALYAQEPCGASAVDLWAAQRHLPEAERTSLIDLAQEHGLTSTLALGLRVARAMFAQAAGDLALPALPLPLAQVAGDRLRTLAWQPWSDATAPLRRRTILAGLCLGQPMRLGAEALRAAASESYRLLLETGPRGPKQKGN